MDMAQVIEQEKHIKTAIRQFRRLIEDSSFENHVFQWAFPNGEKADVKTYKLRTSSGILGVGIPDRQWNNRIPHLFTLSLDVSPKSPDVEINIPLSLDRRVSGVYVKNGEDIWLCSRGRFTAYRGKIKSDIALAYFDKWLVEVEDGGRTTTIIPVAALTSPDITNQIANFVSSVHELKERYKNTEDDDSALAGTTWNNGYEFEGKKTKHSKESETDYEYLHGPICNELHRYLERIALKRRYSISKNKKVDVAIIKDNKAKAIFEVKTSHSLSEQLYKGIGQLLSYRYDFGSSETALFLVVPSIKGKSTRTLSSLVGEVGIHLVENKGSKFILPSGANLNEFVRNGEVV